MRGSYALTHTLYEYIGIGLLQQAVQRKIADCSRLDNIVILKRRCLVPGTTECVIGVASKSEKKTERDQDVQQEQGRHVGIDSHKIKVRKYMGNIPRNSSLQQHVNTSGIFPEIPRDSRIQYIGSIPRNFSTQQHTELISLH